MDIPSHFVATHAKPTCCSTLDRALMHVLCIDAWPGVFTQRLRTFNYDTLGSLSEVCSGLAAGRLLAGTSARGAMLLHRGRPLTRVLARSWSTFQHVATPRKSINASSEGPRTM